MDGARSLRPRSRAPMARYDRMGLIWMLKGERIVAITNLAERLSGGLSFYRRRHG
jgi:hypothetical protein